MGHALHFVVCRAESGEEACETADSHITGWGGEDNGFNIGGAVSEDNEEHIYNFRARWLPKDLPTIEDINSFIANERKPEPVDEARLGKLLDLAVNHRGKMSQEDWQELSDAANNVRHNMAAAFSTPINVLTDESDEGVYDSHAGVTDYHNQYQDEDDGKLWVVFVDMHY